MPPLIFCDIVVSHDISRCQAYDVVPFGTMPKASNGEEKRAFLLRDLPPDLADKLKVAASLHRTSMKSYILDVLQAHIAELERKGLTLTLPKTKR